MLKLTKSALGNATWSRTALAICAATVLIGSSVSEASAKSHRHHHRHHHASNATWRNANASVGSGGRSFSGVASFYGNESGSKTASG